MKKLIIISITSALVAGCSRTTSAEHVDAAKLAFPKCEIYSSKIDGRFVVKTPDGQVLIVEEHVFSKTGFRTIEYLKKRQ